MPKVNQQPDPNRRQTHATNADAHPGKIVMDVLGGRRKKDDIEKDKKAKKERHEARERKKLADEEAVNKIANFENKMALTDKSQETTFPRHRSQAEVNAPKGKPQDKSKKRKSKAEHSPSNHGAVSHNTRKFLETRLSPDLELDNDASDSGKDQPTNTKRQKISRSYVAVPFRRTETYLHHEDIETWKSRVDIPMGDTDIEDHTPKAKEKRKYDMQLEREDENSQGSDSDELDFVTPKALQKKASNFLPGSATSDFSSDIVETTDWKSANEPLNESAESTESTDSDIYVPLKKNLKSVNSKHKANNRDVQDFKPIDLAKLQKKETGAKAKRAFRKEVEERRAVTAKDEISKPPVCNGTSSGDRVSDSAHSKITASCNFNGGRKDTVSKHTSRHSAYTKPEVNSRDSRDSATAGNSVSKHTSGHHFYTKPEVNSRNSATAGNGIGIIRSSHTSGKESSGKSKPDTSADTTYGLSDEDDSVERTSILKSPPKGTKRLSSSVIVKVETGSNEKKKSRSKKHIIDPEVLSGWMRFVEPNFVYFYFFELTPWPTTGAIAACAQNLWDWRFGDLHPLELAKSSAYTQLLNQKLCDIRGQTASSAITSLNAEFQSQLDNHTDSGALQDPDEITLLRQRHADKLLKDKRFIFGKFSVSETGKVRKSRPYQSPLVLRTFASAFKHLKDVKLRSDRDENDGPLPVSLYPKTLLAITTAAIERALELTVAGDYDFDTNKLIPKPDPNHSTRKLTTGMFAFSETIWEPRVVFYLEKSISNLKDKEWEDIMEAAAEFSSILKPSKGKGKAQNYVQRTEEEQELEYDSNSDDDNAV